MKVLSASSCQAGRISRRVIAAFLSLSLLLFIYLNTDLHSLWQNLRQLHLQSILFLVLLYSFGQWLSSRKWGLLLRQMGLSQNNWTLLRAYFLGMFVNNFGFGTVGGDMARALALKPARGQRVGALASVVADRIHGLTVLLALGFVGACLSHTLNFTSLILGVVAAIALISSWLWGPQLLLSVLHRTGFCRSESLIQSLEFAANAFPRSPRFLALVSLLSLIFHCSQVLVVILIARELGVSDVPIVYFFGLVPIINIISALPFSINGVGVREGLYVFFLVPLGVPRETAVAMGAVWLLVVYLVSALGGLAWTSTVKASQSDAEALDNSQGLQLEEVK